MPEFQKAAAVSEIPDGTGKRVELGGKAIALFNVGGNFFAIQERCPHRGGPLSEGTIQGCNLTCPWHAWTFDVKTGDRVGFPPGMGRILTYAVRVEGEDVLVEC